MKNLSNGYGILNDLWKGKIKFLLAYGDPNGDRTYDKGSIISLGTYEMYGATRNDDNNELLIEELEDVYNYFHSYDENANLNVSNFISEISEYDITDEILFKGKHGDIYIPIRKVVEMFSYENVANNTKSMTYNTDLEFKYIEAAIEKLIQEKQEKGEDVYSYLTQTKVKAFSLEEIEAKTETPFGNNYYVIPVSNSIKTLKELYSNPELIIESYEEENILKINEEEYINSLEINAKRKRDRKRYLDYKYSDKNTCIDYEVRRNSVVYKKRRKQRKRLNANKKAIRQRKIDK